MPVRKVNATIVDFANLLALLINKDNLLIDGFWTICKILIGIKDQLNLKQKKTILFHSIFKV